MNEENKSNLVKLAKFILSEVDDGKFDMETFRTNYDSSEVEFYSKKDCGTIGCALGWAPFVPGLENLPEDGDEYKALSFIKYSKRVFGVDFKSVKSTWSFLFSDEWSFIDNSREGFVKRVLFLLSFGEELVNKIGNLHELFVIYNSEVFEEDIFLL